MSNSVILIYYDIVQLYLNLGKNKKKVAYGRSSQGRQFIDNLV